MFEKLRIDYYNKMLGTGIGAEFARFEAESQGSESGRAIAKATLNWLLKVNPEDRIMAIHAARYRRDMTSERERAVRAITRKNRLKFQLEHLKLMTGRTLADSNFQAMLNDLQQQYQIAYETVEDLKERIFVQEKLHMVDWNWLVNQYGEPEFECYL